MQFFLTQTFKKFIYTAVLALTAVGFQINAQSFALDATGVDFSFLTSQRSLISGTQNAAGSVYRYNNLATINGRTIYGRLTIVSTSNITINTLDAEGGSLGSNSWFQPLMTRGTNTNNFGLANFKLEFFDTATDFPVYLYNYNLNAYDVDGSNTNGQIEGYVLPQEEFASIYVRNPTNLTLNSTAFPGNSTVLGQVSENNSTTFNNTSTFYATYTRPKTSITFAMGMTNTLTGQRQYYVKLGTVGGTFSAQSTLATGTAPSTANLGITKTVNKPNAAVGDVVTFTITATNIGAAATNVQVKDIFPSGFTFMSSTVTTGTFNPSTFVWSIGSMANNANATATITARVNTINNYTNIVNISSDLPETTANIANNTSSVTVRPDNDGDGIPNEFDYDSDNDGILDTAEGCAANVTMGTLGASNDSSTNSILSDLRSGNTALFPLVPPGATLPYGGVRISSNLAGDSNWRVFTPNTANTTITIKGTASNSFSTRYLDIIGTVPRTINVDFGVSAGNLSTANNDYYYIIGIAGLGNENNNITNTFSTTLTVLANADVFGGNRYSFLNNAESNVIGATGNIVRSNPNYAQAQGYTFYLIPKNVASFSMILTGGWDQHGMIFGVYRANCNTDTDNDGIPNYLDTDSDNDGCVDAIEGGGTLTASQVGGGRILGAVDANGVPTAVGASGQGIGTSQDASQSTCFDTDGDGIANFRDLDSDNDGILDINECSTAVNETTVSISQGSSATMYLPGTDLGYVFDIYGFDNSFNFEINGIKIFNDEIQFQGTKNIRFKDGTAYEAGTPNIWLMYGTAANPLIKIIIAKNGSVMMYGSKVSEGSLFPLEFFNPSTNATVNANTVTWNQNAQNTVIVTQVVNGATSLNGAGRGFNNAFCDPDGDTVSNQYDTDADGDGCSDAVEGSENVKISQVHSLLLPSTDANYAFRGQIKTLANGLTAGTPAQVVSTSPQANGVPQLVNLAGFNINSNNTANAAGIADNSDATPTSDVGQGAGNSQNASVSDCKCYKNPSTSTAVNATQHGITALNRAGAAADNWPMVRNGGWTALEANTKGFVINRVTDTQMATIATLAPGMMVFNTTKNCLMINTDGTVSGWKCFNTQTCPDVLN